MKLSIRDLLLIALFAALTAVGAFIRIPLPLVPFTLQTFFVALSGALLGSLRGMLAQVVYVGIGLAGVPVFTNGSGPGYVLQPSFGYLLGFIAAAYMIGFLVERMKKISLLSVFPALMAGLFIVYLFGVPYLYIIYNLHLGKTMPFTVALVSGTVPFIGGNTLSLILAAFLTVRLLPILKRLGYVSRGQWRGKQ